MCGICGRYNYGSREPVERSQIQRMCDVLRHRGPDAEGIHLDGPVGLGHRRLSIIDLSGGAQPMCNESEDVWIVLNGEIYNFLTLKEELKAKGHRFRTNSDTEVVIHLYEEYGRDSVRRLRGMFAFSIWDARDGRLFLARDRVGKKPLFYYAQDGCLLFASEIKAILEDPAVKATLDLGAMHDFLTYQYVPAPATIFGAIKKLPPAHTLMLERGKVNVERYWRLSYRDKPSISELEALEVLEGKLSEAVRLRMISDVPLGAFLSGGVDSSVIVALMSRFADGRVKTFSIGFAENEFNELPYARMVASHCQTDHREFVCRPDAVAVLPELIWHFDEPFADSSAIPSYYLARMTSEYVKVVLNGDGGDESFAGYERYLGNRLLRLYKFIPRAARKQFIRRVLAAVSEQVAPRFMNRLNRLNEASLAPVTDQYAQMMIIFPDAQKRALYSPDVDAALVHRDSLDAMRLVDGTFDGDEEIDRLLFSDVEMYLPGDLLVKMDRMTMAHGLEARSPLLDQEVMEFAASLPGGLKLRGTTLKYLLKKLGEHLVPRGVLYRRKQGFGVPIPAWFRGQLRPFVSEVLGDSALAREGYLRQQGINDYMQAHFSGRENHGHRLWALINLELWFRMFILGGGRKETLQMKLHGSVR